MSMDKRLSTELNKLFSDAEIDPAANDTARLKRELEALNTRIRDLEAQLKASEQRAAPQPAIKATAEETHSTTPIIYEQEQVGYAYQGKNLMPVQISTATAAKTENAIQAALTAGEQIIGNIQIESPAKHEWTIDETTLATAVAQQASLQIQNLRLLASTERARAEAQAATRQFTHENWENYLDGIYQNERIGFAYNQAALTPFDEPVVDKPDYQATVDVLDTQVGNLFLKADPAHPLTIEDKDLITSVARQVSQQVENLRLLADASRARANAEQATRSLTRQNWDTFTEQAEGKPIGFMYDSNKVSPLTDQALPYPIRFEQSLVVRGEPIGQLRVASEKNLSPEAQRLTTAIAAQTSIHLETLRLNEELQKRAKELQELDRLKSSFLANMSHELRTPLNSILGFTDVILEGLDGPLTENMDNDLGLIQKNGKHLLSLINDVLDMAKIESGRMNLSLEKFKIQEIVDDVISITGKLAADKQLIVSVESDSDRLVEISADKTRVRQVMINLINNAIKFTEQGRISVHVARQVDHVLIAVKDTGIGIPLAKQAAIFQEFVQVDVSSTRKAGGTGLGLPISRHLIEMHGGRLWIESSGVEGEGSTFFVELPLETKLTDVVEKTSK